MESLVINESAFVLFSAAGQGNPTDGSTAYTRMHTHKQSAGDPEARLRLFMPLRSVSNKDDELLVWGRFVDII